jgi:hypothetical protein
MRELIAVVCVTGLSFMALLYGLHQPIYRRPRPPLDRLLDVHAPDAELDHIPTPREED